jgi:hypothetical protein
MGNALATKKLRVDVSKGMSTGPLRPHPASADSNERTSHKNAGSNDYALTKSTLAAVFSEHLRQRRLVTFCFQLLNVFDQRLK